MSAVASPVLTSPRPAFAAALGPAAALVAALGLQAVVLRHAFTDGFLSGLIPWDDCQTLVRGLANLERIATGEAARVLIHSPLSDLQALAGLAFGGRLGPFLLNGWAAALAAFAVARAARPGLLLTAALAVLLLAQPMTIGALTFLKADWKGGLLFGAAVYCLHQAAARGRPDLRAWGAGLLGLATAAKLTAFHLPVLAAAALAAFELVAYARAREQGPTSLGAYLARERPALARCLALALGPYLVFFALAVVGERQLVIYIAYALGGTWSDGLSLPGRALFYSPFAAGGGAWGSLAWSVLLFGGAALALAIRRREAALPLGLAACAGLAVLALLPLAVAGTSNLEFGAPLLGVALGAALIAVDALARSAPRWGPALALAGCAALAAPASFEPPLFGSSPLRPQAAELAALERTYRQIAADIEARAPSEPRVRLLFEQPLAPFPNLTLIHHERTGALISVDRIDDLGRADLARVHFLLSFRPAGPVPADVLDPRFPTSAAPAQADAFAASRPDFRLVAGYPVRGGEIRLFERFPLRGRL